MIKRKNEWRALVKSMFALIDPDSRRELDAGLNHRLSDLLTRSMEGTLLGFSALPDEPNIGVTLRAWLSGGGMLALPAWRGGEKMALRLVRNLDHDLRPGRAGILEPREDLPECAPDAVKTAIVPGRAFSETGMRLGRGAGCYDALLTGCGMRKIGVAYDFQVFPALPGGESDRLMDLIATPGRLVAFGEPDRKRHG
ncbi:MAG: 5-formyltetrahydrofolate cyclo-ligase [Planctomycetota bacterium]|jgi:5-formyltetrahydrofolate cyclo-ligase|nr:5-formyltetrahydrofolate cyclo-ligase [Planctomycetota bacterium]